MLFVSFFSHCIFFLFSDTVIKLCNNNFSLFFFKIFLGLSVTRKKKETGQSQEEYNKIVTVIIRYQQNCSYFSWFRLLNHIVYYFGLTIIIFIFRFNSFINFHFWTLFSVICSEYCVPQGILPY